MLFNSYEFIFAFLPITLAMFWVLRAKTGHGSAVLWLVLCSLFFYGWWKPIYLFLLLISIVVNYSLSRWLADTRSKTLLVLGVTFNLGLLGYFKYFNFFAQNLSGIIPALANVEAIFLPLAISFFTFQQIAFLADTWQGKSDKRPFLEYMLFVCFFPQLIAGPIVHHSEMLPQFGMLRKFRHSDLACGASMFAIGLFKKAVLADGIAVYANPVFQAAADGASPTFFHAWIGALAYTFQLYFDFSGYSDMAIGLARMFGIKLPANFNSPYKARTISDFWRRWHMTLSRFLRDYLYIAMGGNRHGTTRRYTNLFVTMLLGGLWHGAGWTFVVWGGLHGLYLVIQHAWTGMRRRLFGTRQSRWYTQQLAQLTTFFAVVIGWVFFRASDFDSAWRILGGMFGVNGITVPSAILNAATGLQPVLSGLGITADGGSGKLFVFGSLWIVLLFMIAWFGPNSQSLLKEHEPVLESGNIAPSRLRWAPARPWAIACGVLLAIGILALPEVSEFLYFQF
ncbi:MAG: MBOAT family protein [Gammaproteobacteria bacterium]|nr:MBOAT family protein [Gammaproteobacteria bacterium]